MTFFLSAAKVMYSFFNPKMIDVCQFVNLFHVALFFELICQNWPFSSFRSRYCCLMFCVSVIYGRTLEVMGMFFRFEYFVFFHSSSFQILRNQPLSGMTRTTALHHHCA